jgi:Flp pilus assembly protein TadD
VTPVAAPAAPGAVAGAISPIRTGAEAAASPELRRAEAALAAGRVGTAIPAARRAAAKHRSDARPHLVLGHAYYRKGWHGDALDEFRKAARLDPATRSDPAMLLDAVGCLSRRATAARARAFLLEIGAPAAPVLREAAARHHDADVRARAADTLAQLGQ